MVGVWRFLFCGLHYIVYIAAMQIGVWQKYKQQLQSGKLRPDPIQDRLATALGDLADRLENYHPKKNSGLFGAVHKWRGATACPKGLYIHGPVGRGKSMMMDLFFACAETPQKRRIHFHAFMQDVHSRLFAMRSAKPDLADPLVPLAEQLASEAWLLCFDEFVVQDIADAMILSRLFTALFDCGVVVVATSNVAPDDLYRNGLHRERFLPFISVLKSNVDLFHFDGGLDYRAQRIAEINRYNYPIDDGANAALQSAFAALSDGTAAAPVNLDIKGRRLTIPRAARGVAMAGFDDLCAAALGAGDYLVLAEQFHTVIVSGIPQFNADNRNETKRFITLIDILYDHQVRFICSAACALADLPGDSPHGFELQRTISRLMEMQSPQYPAAA